MSEPETMTEGVAEYHGLTEDGDHVVHVRLTVLHANPESNFYQGAILHVDPGLFERLDADSQVPIVQVGK